MAAAATAARPEANATATLLDEVGQIFDDYVVFPSPQARDAVVLWALHTHVCAAFETTPRLAVVSAEPGSGKSRVREILDQVTPNPLAAVYVQPAVLWRTIEQAAKLPTLLLDEADTVFGRSGSSSSHRLLRSIINAGHHKGATVPRCVGASDVKRFAVFAPCAMAGLGQLPETITTRSVVVAMRPRRGDQEVQQFRMRTAGKRCRAAGQAMETWAVSAERVLRLAAPEMPVRDRDADVWEPLVAIADLAGEAWGARARDACTVLVAAAKQTTLAPADALLADVHAALGDAATITTAALLAALHAVEGGRRWGALTARGLADALAEFGLAPGTIRQGATTAKGYKAFAMPA